MVFAACAAKAMLGKDGSYEAKRLVEGAFGGSGGKPCLLHSCGGACLARERRRGAWVAA